MHQRELYTHPVVCTTNPNDWYIYFEFFHNGKWHSLKKREGINRIKSLKQRRKEAELLAEARLIWLQSGWNPVQDPKFQLRNISTEEGLKAMPFNKAIDFALAKKDLAAKSRIDYRNQLEYVKQAAEKLGIAILPIAKVTRLHILEILTRLREDRKLSNHNYNKYRDTIRSMFTTLESWLAVEYNPATRIDTLRTTESNKYASLDKEEKMAITALLYKQHYRFFVYIQVLYHTGIRPKEILALRIKDINLKKQVITIVPDLERENSKTKTVRLVPVSDQLLPFLIELKLDECPPDHYVFGSPFKTGMGNRGAGSEKWGTKEEQKKTGRQGAKRSDYFTPSACPIKRDTVTKLWKEIIIDGLGIHKHLYALKHTGADDKIVAGIDLDALRDLYGHRSKYMTETYAKKVKEVYSTQIRVKSPAFSSCPEALESVNPEKICH